MASIHDIGIDLSTSTITIYKAGNGIELSEPAVVTIDRDTRAVLTLGKDAAQMVGRTPSGMLAIRPLRNGEIIDYDLLYILLKTCISSVVKKRFLTRINAVLCVPTPVTDIERHSLLAPMHDAGISRTHIVNRAIAGAIGADLSMEESLGIMIVDISAGLTDLSVISYGRVIVFDCIKTGGDSFDEAIIRYIRNKYSLLIGERTAEMLKIEIGTANTPTSTLYREVSGRNLITGLPKTMLISNEDISQALREPIGKIIDSIHDLLEHTPPELASDIFEFGILFMGGGSLLPGLCEVISHALSQPPAPGVPCILAKDPINTVAVGCGRIIENMQELGKYLDNAKNKRLFKR